MPIARLFFKTHFAHLELIVLSLFLSSCGFVIENVKDLKSVRPPAALSIPVEPIYLTASTSYLRANGSCQGYKTIRFVYSSALTPEKKVFGDCADDKIDVQLPVLKGDLKQVFTVKITGFMDNPTQTIEFPDFITVNFTPPIAVMAGYGVTSGGGKTSGPTVMIINQAVGEVFTGTQTSGSVKIRSGLQGALDP